jgi:hypothetical protein
MDPGHGEQARHPFAPANVFVGAAPRTSRQQPVSVLFRIHSESSDGQ